jgi:LPS O-antigen subunit length determinant protein (WzzB/FepE family)
MPEEKNQEHFEELSASIASIQAETQYEVHQVQQEHDSQVQKLREALR